MRALIIAVVIATLLPGSAGAQDALGGFIGGNAEELTMTMAVTVRRGAYAFQPQFPMTLLYDDPYNGDFENGSLSGVFTLMPLIVVLPMGHTGYGGEPVTWVGKFARAYVIAMSVFNSQHHLVFYERERGSKPGWRTASIFAGPRFDHYVFRDVTWGRFALGGGLRYGLWRAGGSDGTFRDRGFGLHVGVEQPWDIVDGEWREQDPLVFAGLVFWGD